MKYVIIIPDGCADWAIESLGNRTPLQAAHLPNMQALARSGIVGQSRNVPDGFTPGSDVATLGLLGYNPSLFYTGRAPLEVVAQGIELADNDWAIRCNLVTINQATMQSFSAGHISSPEAAEIMQTLNEHLAPKSPMPLQFYAGVGYRNLAILRKGEPPPFDSSTKTYPPHDYIDQPFAQALPTGKGSEELQFLMDESQKILADHPVNRNRIKNGKHPATQIWLWGLGQKPQLPPFRMKGAMITAVDLLRGIASMIGWDLIDVPGITGYVDTDFAAKGRYAAEALKKYDLVCVHIEAPDESGHEGSAEKKVRSLEDIDAKVIPPIVEALRSYGEWRLFISPDHPTPCAIKTHTSDHVPWILTGTGIPALSMSYDEESAKDSAYRYDNGWEMIDLLFQ
ncbi:MAG: cofactor-independent phosphoglycerate mutase [Planctomycetaceae bacterium]|jgi:2,3-bisphosphoglycerate-independent phosphoglycerate mutase|nr:cofactor-independent phosphoglycerate mutase [Planctomycetaceae bacterium]